MALIFTAIAPVLSTMGDALGQGVSGYWVGQLTMTMPDIGIIVGSPIAGLLVERLSARVVLFLSFALFGAAGAAGIIIDDAVSMLARRLVLGFEGAGIATSTTALIGSRFAGAARGRVLGYWSAGGAVGGVISILASGRVAAAPGWQSVFGIYLLIFPALVMLSPCCGARLQSFATCRGSVLPYARFGQSMRRCYPSMWRSS